MLLCSENARCLRVKADTSCYRTPTASSFQLKNDSIVWVFVSHCESGALCLRLYVLYECTSSICRFPL